MKKCVALCALSVFLASPFAIAQKENTLTPKEKAEGWRLLFDGKTTAGAGSECEVAKSSAVSTSRCNTI